MQPTFEKLSSKYTHFHYADFRTYGLEGFWDFLRYEGAFINSKDDSLNLPLIVNSYAEMTAELPANLVIPVCRFDWSKRPHWTAARLLSSQRIIEVPPHKLDTDDAYVRAEKPSNPFKFTSRLEVTGKLDHIVMVMCYNRAFPDTEEMSGRMDRALYGSEPVTVRLRTYTTDDKYQWVTYGKGVPRH